MSYKCQDCENISPYIVTDEKGDYKCEQCGGKEIKPSEEL